MTDHGTRATYQRGCRCLPCRAANAAYRPRTPVFAHAVRAHLVELQNRGIGLAQVAALSGVSARHVLRVRSGAVETIGAATADKLLAVRPVPAKGALVPSWPCRRLLDQLGREGFTTAQLRERFGLKARTRAGHRVRASTAARIYAAHRVVTETVEADGVEA